MKTQKEKFLTESIQKNYRLYLSAFTLHEIYNLCDYKVFEELSIQFEILTEEILPFTETISKLEKKYKVKESNLALERATASVYGLDKLLTSEGLISIVGI